MKLSMRIQIKEVAKRRERASRFIRTLLADMDANTLMWKAMELGKLEGKDH